MSHYCSLTISCHDPPQVLNSTWLNAKYSEVEVSDDYLMNIVAFQSHQRKEGMKVYTRWGWGLDRWKWMIGPPQAV